MSELLLVVLLIAFAVYGVICAVKNSIKSIFKLIAQIKQENQRKGDNNVPNG